MIFVSYARKDRQAAAKLVSELAAEGIDCVIDPALTEGDAFWRDAIARRFRECELMIGLVSPHAERSPWVEQEQRAFAGPKLWIAIDHADDGRRSPLGVPSAPVPADRALPAICAALPTGPRQLMRRREPPPARLIGPGERLRHMKEQQGRLDAFLRQRNRFSRSALEIAGDAACITNRSVELQLFAIDAEAPGRTVFVGTRPVTNAQYRAFTDDTGYQVPPTWRRTGFRADDAPVTGVNWFEACAFAAWVGGSLPTEAEWLGAARGNDGARRFATASGDIDPTMACYGRPFGSSWPMAATSYRANPAGYYGLCGNTWDWCATAWGPHRVIRGGGYMDAPAFCTIDTRYRNAPIDRDCCVGFRVKVAVRKAV
jgi:hypothetical protein